MTTKEFIEKAIEGGWRWKYFPGDEHKFRIGDEMKDKSGVVGIWEKSQSSFHISIQDLMLDPKAWQAVGKVEGWDWEGITQQLGAYEANRKMPAWQYQMHRMIDALCEGKTIDEYLQTL